MKTHTLTLAAALLLASVAHAQTLNVTLEDVDSFRDFSVSGMSETKTEKLFLAEMSEEASEAAEKVLQEGTTLEITFTDIDMAGEIQPWRNHYNADIRYIQEIYFPRLVFTYKYLDADGAVLKEGEASINDMAFSMNTRARMQQSFMNFPYEIDLFNSWLRKTFRSES